MTSNEELFPVACLYINFMSLLEINFFPIKVFSILLSSIITSYPNQTILYGILFSCNAAIMQLKIRIFACTGYTVAPVIADGFTVINVY
ncbi:Uncharacterised protein [Yersinia enterocolitica]|nr:Uncharacterised protein [Yersinia enterocolitica]CQR17536.1 Uncharacterised protein [Yersinia enterocolitica]